MQAQNPKMKASGVLLQEAVLRLEAVVPRLEAVLKEADQWSAGGEQTREQTPSARPRDAWRRET